jgi:hypothetical protein
MLVAVLHLTEKSLPFCSGQGVARLTSMLLSRAQPKRIGSNIVTGPMLAGLAEAYCAAINDGAVPTISTAWQVSRVGIFSISYMCAGRFPNCGNLF